MLCNLSITFTNCIRCFQTLKEWIPASETLSQLLFCHSGQAKRDPESGIISKFWIPACAGMTTLMVISGITTQSLRGNDKKWKIATVRKTLLAMQPKLQNKISPNSNKITGMKPQSKLWKQIPQHAAGYYTLRFAGLDSSTCVSYCQRVSLRLTNFNSLRFWNLSLTINIMLANSCRAKYI